MGRTVKQVNVTKLVMGLNKTFTDVGNLLTYYNSSIGTNQATLEVCYIFQNKTVLCQYQSLKDVLFLKNCQIKFKLKKAKWKGPDSL